jgi:hypothetical protein
MKKQMVVLVVVSAMVGFIAGVLGRVTAAEASPMEVVSAAVTGAAPTQTQEVLVSNVAPTLVPAVNLAGRKAIEVLNLNPSNSIWCALGNASDAIVGKSREVKSAGGVWALDADDKKVIYCISAAAAQSTGAGTVVTELK